MNKIAIITVLVTSAFGINANQAFLGKPYIQQQAIPFTSSLGCGACITGGYVYCVPGAEGSDPTTWGRKAAICCKDALCPQAKDTKSYNCSSQYQNTLLAKALCPFKKANCGNSSAFNFTSVGQEQDISISLGEGDTCTYIVSTECGLPEFNVSSSSGFQIEVVEYDDEDLLVTPIASRYLRSQHMPLKAKKNNTVTPTNSSSQNGTLSNTSSNQNQTKTTNQTSNATANSSSSTNSSSTKNATANTTSQTNTTKQNQTTNTTNSTTPKNTTNTTTNSTSTNTTQKSNTTTNITNSTSNSSSGGNQTKPNRNSTGGSNATNSTSNSTKPQNSTQNTTQGNSTSQNTTKPQNSTQSNSTSQNTTKPQNTTQTNTTNSSQGNSSQNANQTTNPIVLPKPKDFGTPQQSLPRPSRSFTFNISQSANATNNKGGSPRAYSYGTVKKDTREAVYKNGAAALNKQPLCKRRYQQISVTATSGANRTIALEAAKTGQLLQSMTLSVGSADFTLPPPSPGHNTIDPNSEGSNAWVQMCSCLAILILSIVSTLI
ncbi:hypothetical protein FGO68_gene3593 [Halteria grandinella]|uniref:Uncharacterized protein n=1 Tax=Halteria grandinella TaxID=5974 RepID=A0A8J8T3D2_HALGN|nr:hypothetical protein FGO68_gene3593 [Halteria grandinella]